MPMPPPARRTCSTRGRQDAVTVFGAHGRSDRPQIVCSGDARQLLNGRKRWLARNDAGGSGNPQVADEVAKAGVVVHEQDTCVVVTHHSERVWHTAWHRDPMPCTDEELFLTT